MNKKDSVKMGLGFGVTSGTITTLGLMIGLHSIIESKIVLIGGVLTIAIADALADSLGIHVAKEAINKYTKREVWEATFVTFFTKFFIALSFIVPILFFSLDMAVLINVFWGMFLLGTFSYLIAKEQNANPWRIVGEHILIAVCVVIATHYVQQFIKRIFC
ncbi:TPA: hypothetical protein DEO28_01495 [Candidatus Dependentiae bacterium]|nr:hypothetical protein [Candidatus Dependentiae bacterium]HBZ73173.1 hypothetical protein [Candidatus Dependentiae bacterium]